MNTASRPKFLHSVEGQDKKFHPSLSVKVRPCPASMLQQRTPDVPRMKTPSRQTKSKCLQPLKARCVLLFCFLLSDAPLHLYHNALLSKVRLSEENLAHTFCLHTGYASLGQAAAAKPVPVNSVGIALLFLCPQLQGTQQ